MKNIVINTLVFAQAHSEGMTQFDMIKLLNVAGYKKIEVRREYFKDIPLEVALIAEYVSTNNIELFYSVPNPLYENGKLKIDEIKSYFEEAKVMLCSHVKMIVGDYQKIEPDDVLVLNEFSIKYGVNLTVENDQTFENGTSEHILNFVTEFKKKGGQIGVTFDAGNWIWVNENPVENAQKLAPFVTYLHLKDVTSKKNPEPVYLNHGIINWKEIMSILPAGIPIALEYPMGAHVIKDLNIQCSILKI